MNRILLGTALVLLGLFTSPAWAQPATAPVTSAAPVAPPGATLPALEDFEYARGIEWGGFHVQMSLKLVRQADGSYLADVGGEKHVPRTGVPLSEADLLKVREELEGLSWFPTDSFAGAGNHWYTEIKATGATTAGAPWAWTRWFYESGTGLDTDAAKLETAVAALIDQIEAGFTKKINPWTRAINTSALTIRTRVRGTPVVPSVNPLGTPMTKTMGPVGTTPATPMTPVTPVTTPVLPTTAPIVPATQPAPTAKPAIGITTALKKTNTP